MLYYHIMRNNGGMYKSTMDDDNDTIMIMLIEMTIAIVSIGITDMVSIVHLFVIVHENTRISILCYFASFYHNWTYR